MKTEPPRTRKHGTKVHVAKTAADLLAAFRDVLANGYAKINGVTVDLTTASMVVNTTDAMREEARANWLAKLDGYFTEGKNPALIVAFWVNTFWKAHKAAR